MEMLCAGAGGERIGNKMKDARENINSVGGQDEARRCFSASLFLKLLVRSAKIHLFVHSSTQPGNKHLYASTMCQALGQMPGQLPGTDLDGHL